MFLPLVGWLIIGVRSVTSTTRDLDHRFWVVGFHMCFRDDGDVERITCEFGQQLSQCVCLSNRARIVDIQPGRCCAVEFLRVPLLS